MIRGGPASIAASERDEGRRCGFRLQILQHAASQFVIVDESGYNLNLTTLYARAPQGERAYAHVPRNTPATTTLDSSTHNRGYERKAQRSVLNQASSRYCFSVR